MEKKVNNDQSKNSNMPWASAMDGAMTMSSWLVGPLVVALIVGNYLDNKLATNHTYLYISLGIAFLLTIVGLVIQVRKYIKWSSFAEATDDTSPNVLVSNGESTTINALNDETKKD